MSATYKYNTDDQTFTMREELHWASFDARTGEEVSRGTDWACIPTDAEMTAWNTQAALLVARWSNRLSDLETPLYIRFGSLPKSGKSQNYASGKLEAGISVYGACYDLESGVIRFDERGGLFDPYLLSRAVYLVTGEEVGIGSDGEVLLSNVRRLGKVRYDAERKGFVRA